MTGGADPSASAVAELEASAEVIPQSATDAMDSGEIVLLLLRPSAWFIPLTTLPWLPWVVGGSLLLAFISGDEQIPWDVPHALLAGLAALSVRALFQTIDWLGRWYVLTDRRLLVRARVPAQVTQMQLKEVARVDTQRTRLERFIGVGMITCWRHRSNDSPQMYWRVVKNPEGVRRQILEAMNRYRR